MYWVRLQNRRRAKFHAVIAGTHTLCGIDFHIGLVKDLLRVPVHARCSRCNRIADSGGKEKE